MVFHGHLTIIFTLVILDYCTVCACNKQNHTFDLSDELTENFCASSEGSDQHGYSLNLKKRRRFALYFLSKCAHGRHFMLLCYFAEGTVDFICFVTQRPI